jgi:hypothetical protein
LERHDFYAIGQLPLLARVLGLVLFYAEWSALFFQPALGEEVLVVARKQTSAKP